MPQKSFEKNIFSPFQNLITKIVEVKYKNKINLLNLFKKFSDEIIFILI